MSSSSNKYSTRTCQQLKHNGDRCQSAALRGKKFCYYHEHSGPPQIDISENAAIPPVHFYLPLLDDATSIQAAITQVCEHLLYKRIDPKRAGVLLYAMQVAASNLGRLTEDRRQQKNEENSGENSEDKHSEKSAEASAPVPPSSETTLSSHDNNTLAGPDRLPPGTIQACEQPRRRAASSGVAPLTKMKGRSVHWRRQS
jgi:hypothetical protein